MFNTKYNGDLTGKKNDKILLLNTPEIVNGPVFSPMTSVACLRKLFVVLPVCTKFQGKLLYRYKTIYVFYYKKIYTTKNAYKQSLYCTYISYYVVVFCTIGTYYITTYNLLHSK